MSPPNESKSRLERSKNKNRKKPDQSPDYLTPMRNDRLHYESLRGKYDVDFNAMKGRARAHIRSDE